MTAQPPSEHEQAPGLAAFRMTRRELAMVEANRRRGETVAPAPSLGMRIWRGVDGVHLVLHIDGPGLRPGSRSRTQTVLRQAVWQPAEVTEQRLVEWARRACASWLEEQALSAEALREAGA